MTTDMIVGNPIIISGSTDGGSRWARLFSGTMRSINTTVDLRKEMATVIASDGRLLRHTDFNNSVFEYSNFKKLFIGSEKHGEWYYFQDVDGNYPNGLLHNSGLTYSGPPEIYTGTTDLPDTLYFNNSTLFDVTKKFCNIFAMSFYLTPSDNIIRFVSNSVDYPTFSEATISYGRDINKSSLKQDYSNFSDRVIIHDKNIFYQRQSPTKKLWDVENEAWISEEELANPMQAKQLSDMYFTMYSESINRGSIVLPPYTHSVLGKRISVDDATHGWTDMGNVVGVSHDISTDRWTTKIDIDNKFDIPEQTLAEALDKIDKLKQKKDYIAKHDGFLYLDWNWDTEEHEHFSPGGGQTNERIYRESSSNDPQYPCILAVGTNSEYDATMTDIRGKIYAYEVMDYLEDDSYYFKIPTAFPTTTNQTDSEPLIKELVLFFYTDSVAPNYRLQNVDLNRPTTQAEWDSAWNVQTLGSVDDGKSYLMTPPVSVFLEGNSFHPFDPEVDIKIAWQDYDSGSEDTDEYSLLVTDSEWGNEGWYYRISQSERFSMAYDDGLTPTTFFSYTHSLGADNQNVKMKIETKLGLNNTSIDMIRRLYFNIVARLTYTKWDEATQSQEWRLYVSKKTPPYGTEWKPTGSLVELPVGEWGSASFEITPTDIQTVEGIFDDGKLYISLAPYDDCKASTDVILDVAYFDIGYQVYSDSDKLYYLEAKCGISTDGEYLTLPFVPAKISRGSPAIYMASDDAWFGPEHRYKVSPRSWRLEGDKVYMTERATNFPSVFVGNKNETVNWITFLNQFFIGKRNTAPKKWQETTDRHYEAAMFVTRDQIQLPLKKYEEGTDFDYYISPKFDDQSRDEIRWRTSSQSGNVYPRHPAYLLNYVVECPYLTSDLVEDNKYKLLKREGFDKTMTKQLLLQFKYVTSS